jgi:hypothetical protein
MCYPWLATLTSGIINNKVLFLDELEIFYSFVRIVDTFFKPKYILSKRDQSSNIFISSPM